MEGLDEEQCNEKGDSDRCDIRAEDRKRQTRLRDGISRVLKHHLIQTARSQVKPVSCCRDGSSPGVLVFNLQSWRKTEVKRGNSSTNDG